MDAKSQAESDIFAAADRWAREIMRTDKDLNAAEQALLEAVMRYQRFLRSHADLHAYVEIPKPPHLPKDLIDSIVAPPVPSSDDHILKDTVRYSQLPTMPSPPRGMHAVRPEDQPEQPNTSIDDIKHNDEIDSLWDEEK